MTRTPVSSSQIVSMGHDALTNVLEIEFKGHGGKPGSVYQYQNVPEHIYKLLIGSESVGKYFGRVIKPHPDMYPFKKITN